MRAGVLKALLENVFGLDFTEKVKEFCCWSIDNKEIIMTAYSDLEEYKSSMLICVTNLDSFFSEFLLKNESSESPSFLKDFYLNESKEAVIAKIIERDLTYENVDNRHIKVTLGKEYSVNDQSTMGFFEFTEDERLSIIYQCYYADNNVQLNIQNMLRLKYGQPFIIEDTEMLRQYSNTFGAHFSKLEFYSSPFVYALYSASDSVTVIFQFLMDANDFLPMM